MVNDTNINKVGLSVGSRGHAREGTSCALENMYFRVFTAIEERNLTYLNAFKPLWINSLTSVPYAARLALGRSSPPKLTGSKAGAGELYKCVFIFLSL